MNFAEELRTTIIEDIIEARKIKNHIEQLSEKQALDEVEKLSYMQMKTILQLYVMGAVV
jgi:hypothetical protein